ncbi:MAG TPA: ABC transporter ATP-binding protein [Chitinophagales bacterium]|nr:ABC transporter ATP-binding protein [Chitinophagales bacterium]HMX04707.1 ABC transporter ATP-binding protein [Chitinophagales bacterium]HNA57386.1 ABC transporter ATP-binding protein [Chitinophagales bacterium]HNE45569.1 ABC transporter ATP-binding protein [Chitinophagales bacterium]HNF67768.1 ABC transporter ATP-binding protein [Chitinophagales bacterium]
MLTISNLTKSFGDHVAVDGISLSIAKGMFYGLLGPNGAGKTTTIQMISSILPPDSGKISVDGLGVYEHASVKMHMGIVPQEIALYDELTALENLIFWGNLYAVHGKTGKDRAAFLLDWVGLADRRHDIVKNYSGGMKRRVNIAAALMHDPGLIVMDEPTVGIDPQSRNKIYELLDELHHQGKTILYTTHYMEEAERMCDKIGIIDKGKIIAEGSLDELKKAHAQEENIVIHFTGEAVSKLGNYVISFPEPQMMTVVTPQARKRLHDVVQLCTEGGIDITGIDIHDAGLESIFLNLTGRQLRD